MSAAIKTKLTVLYPHRASEVTDFATKVTRERSYKEIGFDLTDPANQDEYKSFCVDYTNICWSQSAGLTTLLNDNAVVQEIVNRFPDVWFYLEECRDGQYYSAYLHDGIYEEIHTEMHLDVGVDNPEAYARLAEVFKEKRYPPFFIFPLGDITFRNACYEALRILNRISAILPGEKLYCILAYHDLGECDAFSYWKKCISSDGMIDWQEVSREEDQAIEEATDYVDVCFENKPNDEVFKILFDDSYRKELFTRQSKRKEEETREIDDSEDLPF